MAFDESLAARIRDALSRKKGVEEKKMFGGIGFLLNGNMLVGVWNASLIVNLITHALLPTVVLLGAAFPERLSRLVSWLGTGIGGSG